MLVSFSCVIVKQKLNPMETTVPQLRERERAIMINEVGVADVLLNMCNEIQRQSRLERRPFNICDVNCRKKNFFQSFRVVVDERKRLGCYAAKDLLFCRDWEIPLLILTCLTRILRMKERFIFSDGRLVSTYAFFSFL